MLEQLIGEASRLGASDIHVRSGERPKMRVCGSIVASRAPVLTEGSVLALLASIVGEEIRSSESLREERDVAFEACGRRCRLHLFCDSRGAAAVIRLLPGSPPTFDSLGLPEAVASISSLERGLVLVTGPAGAGKSSTLAAVVNHINSSRAAHIITIEDPIEILHESRRSLVTQREVTRHTGSCAGALRAALREDPDVLLVGEMRDLETVELALTAAETGHLVLATLHAGSAVQSVSRLVDVFPSGKQPQIRTTLAESLSAVVSQVLLPRRGGGRIPITEVLRATPAVRSLIREGKTHQLSGVMQASSHAGMITMEQRMRQLQDSLAVRQEDRL